MLHKSPLKSYAFACKHDLPVLRRALAPCVTLASVQSAGGLCKFAEKVHSKGLAELVCPSPLMSLCLLKDKTSWKRGSVTASLSPALWQNRSSNDTPQVSLLRPPSLGTRVGPQQVRNGLRRSGELAGRCSMHTNTILNHDFGLVTAVMKLQNLNLTAVSTRCLR